MKINELLAFNSLQIVFPEFQNEDLKKFGLFIKNICGGDAQIERRATNDKKKKALKEKDISHINLKISVKGIFGLILCMMEFEETLQVNALKKLYKFDLPKEIRLFYDNNYEYLEKFKKQPENFIASEKSKFDEIESCIRLKLKTIIKQKTEV